MATSRTCMSDLPLFSMLHKRKSLSIRLPGQILHGQYKTMICFMPYTCICRPTNHHLAARLHRIPWSWLGFESHLQCTKLEHSMVPWKCTTWKGQYTAVQNLWQLAGGFQPWLPASRMVHVCSLKPIWQSRRRLSSCCGRWETMLSQLEQTLIWKSILQIMLQYLHFFEHKILVFVSMVVDR